MTRWTRFPWSTRRRLALAAVLVVLFVMLSYGVAKGWTDGFDKGVLHALRAGSPDPWGPELMPEIVRDITALGSTAVGIIAMVLATVWTFVARRPKTATLQVLLVSVGVGLVYILKDVFGRTRPDIFPDMLVRHGASYPSGHTMTATVVYLTVSLFLLRGQVRWKLRIYLLSSAAIVAVMVGLSRVYLGAHFPTDVMAAWLLGSAWALFASAVADWAARMGWAERSEGGEPGA